MNQVQQILERIKLLLIKLGFKEITITNQYRSEVNYVRGDLFCIPQYVESLGFLVEYAFSFQEAQKHFHEDGESFPLAMGENAILAGIEAGIRKNMQN